MRIGELLGPELVEIARQDPEALKEGCQELLPADLAEALQDLPPEDGLLVLERLGAEQVGAILSYATGGLLKVALTRLPPRSLGQALDALEPDDAARLLSFLPEERRRRVLEGMSARDAAEARGLLAYEAGTAGRLMTSRFVTVRPEWTVAETLEHLRRADPDVATVADLYVVDGSGSLAGVVSLRKLLPSPPTRRVEALMSHEVISIGPATLLDEVARLFSKYGFSAIPVVAEASRPLGVVTMDDAFDFLVTRETERALRMGGVQDVSVEPWEKGLLDYFGTSIVGVVRSRIGWLLLLFVAETLTGTVLRHFEDELAKVVALSFFIPLIIGTGGNAGSQTVSTIIRALALGQVKLRDGARVLLRETMAGMILGLLLCLAAFVRVVLWGTGMSLALVVGLTMLCVCAWANVVGAVVPLLAQRVKIDPTVVSAPLITTVVDATGLAIYMLIAKVVLKL